MVTRSPKPRTAARSAIAATAILEASAVREERTMAPLGVVGVVGAVLALVALYPVLGAATGLVAFACGFAVFGFLARRRHTSR